MSSAPLPGGEAQTFPTCISHFGRPLVQARKSRQGLPDSSTPEAQWDTDTSEPRLPSGESEGLDENDLQGPS